MNKLHLLTYADELFEAKQLRLMNQAAASNVFDRPLYARRREDLVPTQFYTDNRFILDQPKGGGYCLWKPYYILEVLSLIDENDILLYMDSADWINSYDGMRDRIIELMKDRDILPTRGEFKNSDWTRKDTFVLMDCDTQKYWYATQLEAGVLLLKKTDYTIKFVQEWLHYCKNPHILTEMHCEHGYNTPTFCEHRYDQSVLTNLCVREGIEASRAMRDYIICNYEEQARPKSYWDKEEHDRLREENLRRNG